MFVFFGIGRESDTLSCYSSSDADIPRCSKNLTLTKKYRKKK